MAGRDVDADPVFIPLFNRHELICKDAVVSPDDISGVHILAEGNQVVLGSLQRGTLVQLLEHLLHFYERVLVKHIDAA